jgi:hypothetical protein
VTNFLTELARSPSDRSRHRRIQTELFGIKHLFLNKQRSNLTKVREAMLKLAYIAMIGVEIDFGLPEIISLISSDSFASIRVGWLALVVLGVSDEVFLGPIIPILQRQLTSFENDPVQCVALSAVSEMSSPELMRVIGATIAEIAISPRATDFVRKRSLLVIVKIYRITQESFLFAKLEPAFSVFLESISYTIRLAAATAAFCLMSTRPGLLTGLCDQAVSQLYRMFVSGASDPAVRAEFYFDIPSPWFARMLIKIMCFKPAWAIADLGKIDAVANALFSRVGEKLAIRPAMAYFIVFSEMLSLLSRIPTPIATIEKCATTLTRYLESDRPYILYFALDSLNRLLRTNPQVVAAISASRPRFFVLLRSPDAGIVQFSFNLLYILGSSGRFGREIVGEMMAALPGSPLDIRDGFCAKIARLALELREGTFFVDVLLALFLDAGDYCSAALARSSSRVIVSDPALQEYTTRRFFSVIEHRVCIPARLTAFAMYVAGDSGENSARAVLNFIFMRFTTQPRFVQEMMTTTVMKICTKSPGFIPQCYRFLKYQCRSPHTEVSDRAQQYIAIIDRLPALAPRLVARKPPDFPPGIIDETFGSLLDSGVSTFDVDELEDVDLPGDGEAIEQFRFTNGGFLYHDLFVNIYAEFTFGPPQVEVALRFDNNGLFPLGAIIAKIKPPPEMRVAFEQTFSALHPGASESMNAVFFLDEITSEFPVLELEFLCCDTKRVAKCLIPLHLSRIVSRASLALDQFDPQLREFVPILCQSEDPVGELARLVAKFLGIVPVRVEGEDVAFVGTGVYHCLRIEVGLFARVIFNPSKRQVGIFLRATTGKALKVIAGLLRGASLH